ncbi:sugar nucleotide-binding protein [Tessaracoccus oleiagri]|uniref:dTDP-4-dehydrorhamnose reductase n=1 Tax=Tessaracoccus oleiagri TaxID=686624 RepID=A0A1G9HH52_9ACTN|nr:bifunctional dTDP-4-dehydrorhamnose 3,5-epimerase family protein/NAD(P)-dependent oxidoreductase [Tessaracoccus oleiagri]SDL11833.1 dTDP-4-dehydrorhamnose reductase [Tessaracoccus oleiagri]
MSADLRIEGTPIEGLLLVHLPLHGDARGWFKEHWHRSKMTALGLPDFKPVQQNVSFNADRGTTRGLHAEPWDKYVSVVNGSAFGAWVDLREGASFGTLFTAELRPDTAVFVPRGVANGFQTLEADTNYSYLVNDHWSPNAEYALVNLADPALSIQWPIPLDDATISEKDRLHPELREITPVPPKKTAVLGSDGQLGRAIRVQLGATHIDYLTRDDLDLTDSHAIERHDWSGVGAIINAAAYTAVDGAETHDGRRHAWQINSTAVRDLARVCIQHDITLVHISTDYVFDGEELEHPEGESLSPLNNYGASKAAGELAASLVPKHYILRTSWVVGDGNNFVRTMAKLARDGVEASVIADQYGRLTFAEDLAGVIQSLLSGRQPWGVYNVTSGGPLRTWYEIATEVYSLLGVDPSMVSPITAADYAAQRRAVAPHAERPRYSGLPMDELQRLGIAPSHEDAHLRRYLKGLHD